jgi:hypothetical protein
MRPIPSLALVLALAGCGQGGGDLPFGDGKADHTGIEVVDANVGDRFTGLTVEAREDNDLEETAKVFRVEVTAEQAVLITMRTDSEDLDSYLGVDHAEAAADDGPEGEEEPSLLVEGYNQALLPMARGTDALVLLHEPGGYLVVAANEDERYGGTFSVEFVPIALGESEVFDAGITDARVRALHGDMSEHEALVVLRIAEGLWVEGDDGLLAENLDAVRELPLKDIAALRREMNAVNSLRETLFASYAEAADAPADSVAQVCAQAWRWLRE